MKKYRLYRKQYLHGSLPEVWRFFSAPSNLSRITPVSMRFEIVRAPSQDQIWDGMEIEYRVTPMAGLRMRWRTQIQEVVPEQYFTDVQASGPYAYWRHRHVFTPEADGVWMEDDIEYVLPFGWFGRLFHGLLVLPKLETIFEYRQKVISGLFGNPDQKLSS